MKARAGARRALTHSGVIICQTTKQRFRCRVLDISHKGAKLSGLPIEVPNSFVLLLTADGQVTRNCKLVWRNDDVVGVQFADRVVASTKTATRPEVKLDC